MPVSVMSSQLVAKKLFNTYKDRLTVIISRSLSGLKNMLSTYRWPAVPATTVDLVFMCTA